MCVIPREESGIGGVMVFERASFREHNRPRHTAIITLSHTSVRAACGSVWISGWSASSSGKRLERNSEHSSPPWPSNTAVKSRRFPSPRILMRLLKLLSMMNLSSWLWRPPTTLSPIVVTPNTGGILILFSSSAQCKNYSASNQAPSTFPLVTPSHSGRLTLQNGPSKFARLRDSGLFSISDDDPGYLRDLRFLWEIRYTSVYHGSHTCRSSERVLRRELPD